MGYRPAFLQRPNYRLTHSGRPDIYGKSRSLKNSRGRVILTGTELVTPIALSVELVCQVVRFVELSSWRDTPGSAVYVKSACVPDGFGTIEVKTGTAPIFALATWADNFPPAVVKLPPTYNWSLPDTASAYTTLFKPDPMGDHALPFHFAICG